MAGRIDARLQELKIELPDAAAPVANYVPFVRTGDLLFVSGQICQWNNKRRFVGRVGAGISLESAQQAARLCGLNILAQARAAVSDLDRVRRCVRINGFVNSAPDFVQQPQVINGCSDLFVEVLGDAGRHSRIAVGVASLPGGAAVEIDAIFEVS
ncbi:MAG: RidA family protein [Alphaproteobacteria bacterium]|nr:RidA family protein [Alphaproteobacteria bacterium]